MGLGRRAAMGGGRTDLGPWSGGSTSTPENNPVRHIQRAMSIVEKESGHTPNCLVMNRNTFRKIVDNDSFRDLYKYNAPGLTPAQTLAGWIGIEQIVLSGITENTSSQIGVYEGDFVFGGGNSVNTGDHAVLLYCERSGGMEAPSCLKMFNWNSYINSTDGSMRTVESIIGIRNHINYNLERDEIRGYRATDIKMTSALLGFALFNIAT